MNGQKVVQIYPQGNFFPHLPISPRGYITGYRDCVGSNVCDL